MAKNPRLSGIVCILAGAVLTYLCVWMPYQDAVHHAEQLSLNFKGVLLSVFCLCYGPPMSLMPPQAAADLSGPARSPLQILFLVVALGIAGGFYYWFRGLLGGMGYTFNGI